MNKKTAQVLLLTMLIMGLLVFLFGLIILIATIQNHGNIFLGLFLIIYGIFWILVPIVIYAIIYLLNRKKANEYESWLSSKGFTINRLIGGIKVPAISNKYGFVVDAKQQRWGKYLSKFLLRPSSIVSVDIHKNGASMTTTTDFSKGKIKFHSGHAHTSGMTFGTAESKDTSTYDVYIQTSNPQMPVVEIPCERNYNAAQNICGLIRIWIGDGTEESYGYQAENTTYTQYQPTDIATELKKYQQLLADGLITEEDFNIKKKQLLGI